MPQLIVPNEALQNWLTALVVAAPVMTACRLRLLKSTVPIDRYTTAGVLVAAEADYPGYAPTPLGGWSEPIIDDNEAITEADAVAFTASAETSQSVYGCFATLNGDDTLLGAAAFDAGVPMSNESELQIVCTFDLRSLFPE